MDNQNHSSPSLSPHQSSSDLQHSNSNSNPNSSSLPSSQTQPHPTIPSSPSNNLTSLQPSLEPSLQPSLPTTSINSTSSTHLPSSPSQDTPPQLPNDFDDPNSLSPQLRQLASMFPQIQPSILDAVLAAHANDPSACVSDLLAMSDPSWKPSSQDVMAQSDAQLARQLAFQDSQQSSPQPSDQAQQMNLPYQPRIKKPVPLRPTQQWHQDPRSDQPQSAGLSPSGKDEIQKIAEELGKLAETGKKTVSSWLNKAKTKMQELQQPALSPPPENLDASEHLSAPTPSELATTNRPSAGSSTARSSRISPALPYASRYQTPAQPATPPPSTRSIGQTAAPKAEGYKIDEAGSTGVATTGSQAGSSTHMAVAGNKKAKEDDEESLEYTRNPFEDED